MTSSETECNGTRNCTNEDINLKPQIAVLANSLTVFLRADMSKAQDAQAKQTSQTLKDPCQMNPDEPSIRKYHSNRNEAYNMVVCSLASVL